MVENSVRRKEIQHEQFEAAVRKGLAASAKLILKISSNCVKQIKDSPVGSLAINVDQTLRTFVSDKSDGLLRFNMMAEPIVNLVVNERTKSFTQVDEVKKIVRTGQAFGFMSGIAVLTSVIKIFLLQADDNLNKRDDLSDDAKSLCLQYINDVFTVLLQTLSDQLDTSYRVPQKERILFAELLSQNDWNAIFDKLKEKQSSETDSLPAAES